MLNYTSYAVWNTSHERSHITGLLNLSVENPRIKAVTKYLGVWEVPFQEKWKKRGKMGGYQSPWWSNGEVLKFKKMQEVLDLICVALSVVWYICSLSDEYG